MKIVLLDDVAKLGRKFEIKNVANGYARNALIPKGLAARADPATVRRIEILKKQHEQSEKQRQAQAVQSINQLSGTIINMAAKANDQGHLFEGIHPTEIAAAIKQETKIDLDPSWLKLERPIKAVGDYDLAIVHGDTKGQIKLRVQTLP